MAQTTPGIVQVDANDGIATISLSRPPVNAISYDGYEEIAHAFESVSARSDVNVVVLKSAIAGMFTAGADLKEARSGGGGSDQSRQDRAHRMLTAIRLCSMPVIAAVDGPAIGAGAAIIASADIRIATERSTVSLPEITIGRAGGARHLMRLVPQGVLRRMYFTGESLDAVEGHRVGLIDELVADSVELDAAVDSLARAIAKQSPTALRWAKEAINLAEDLPVEAGYRLEQQFTLRLANTPDAREAVVAWAEKRAPQWSSPV